MNIHNFMTNLVNKQTNQQYETLPDATHTIYKFSQLIMTMLHKNIQEPAKVSKQSQTDP